MDEFVLGIDKDKFRSTNAKWNELMLNDPWSVGYVSTLIEASNWKSKEEWEETYYASGAVRNRLIEENAAKLGYTKEFFNDTTVPHNKAKYYALSWDVKNLNTQMRHTNLIHIRKTHSHANINRHGWFHHTVDFISNITGRFFHLH